MKIIVAAICAAALCAAGLSAQTSERTTSSKITVKEGKDVSVTGCIERSATSETGFLLTKVADKRGTLHSYVLVSEDNEDLAKHVGHLVKIEGKAADRGYGKVKIETRTTTKDNHDDHETRTTESKGDLPHLPFLGVHSVKLVAGACP